MRLPEWGSGWLGGSNLSEVRDSRFALPLACCQVPSSTLHLVWLSRAALFKLGLAWPRDLGARAGVPASRPNTFGHVKSSLHSCLNKRESVIPINAASRAGGSRFRFAIADRPWSEHPQCATEVRARRARGRDARGERRSVHRTPLRKSEVRSAVRASPSEE